MSRRLLILRHAKAEDNHAAADHERALTSKGRRQAEAVGEKLAEAGAVPDHVICSTSLRTRQTLQLALTALSTEPTVDFEESAYGAGPDTVLDLVQRSDPDIGTLMVVGHNPTMAQLASMFTEAGGLVPFPTASIALVELEVDWLYTAPGAGHGRLLA